MKTGLGRVHIIRQWLAKSQSAPQIPASPCDGGPFAPGEGWSSVYICTGASMVFAPMPFFGLEKAQWKPKMPVT
jgi:hypothetical protein